MKALIAKSSIPTLFSRIEQFFSRSIDGKILAGILKMAYHCGLKKGEILGLTVNDVTAGPGRRIAQKINVGSKKILINSQVKIFIRAHLKYLKKRGYQVFSTTPLFPEPHKKTIKQEAHQRGQEKKYNPRKLDFHLRKATTGIRGWGNLERIRQAGVCDFYGQGISKGTPPDEALKAAMGFARCETGKFIRGLLASPREDIDIIVPLTKLQRMVSSLSEVGISDDQSIKRAQRFCRALDKDKTILPARKEDLKNQLIKAIAGKGIILPPSKTSTF